MANLIMATIIILLFTFIGYHIFKFIQLLVKMRTQVIFPITNDDMNFIRKNPEKPLKAPNVSEQKTGLFFHGFLLILIVVMFTAIIITDPFNIVFYPLLLITLLNLTHLKEGLNVVGMLEEGLLIGGQFISWNKIKYFYVEIIDMNHKYYGYSKEANNGYEFKFKLPILTTSFVVTSVEMKKQLTLLLQKHIKVRDRSN